MKDVFMRGFAYLSLVLSFSTDIFAANFNSLPDVRSISLGNVHALSNEFVNPAYLSFRNRSLLGISVHNYFQIKELNTYEVCFCFPNRFLDGGVKFSALQFSDYSLIQGVSGFSKKIGSSVSLGCNLHYASERMGEDGSFSIKADAGTIIKCSEKIMLGVLLRNTGGYNFSENVFLHAGIDYRPFLSSAIMIEVASDLDSAFSLMAGFEYELMERICFRAGFRINPSVPSLGFAYSTGIYTMDISFAFHPVLGNNTSVGISYRF